MTPEADLVVIRRAYAKTIAFLADTDDPRLVAALAEVPASAWLRGEGWALTT